MHAMQHQHPPTAGLAINGHRQPLQGTHFAGGSLGMSMTSGSSSSSSSPLPRTDGASAAPAAAAAPPGGPGLGCSESSPVTCCHSPCSSSSPGPAEAEAGALRVRGRGPEAEDARTDARTRPSRGRVRGPAQPWDVHGCQDGCRGPLSGRNVHGRQDVTRCNVADVFNLLQPSARCPTVQSQRLGGLLGRGSRPVAC